MESDFDRRAWTLSCTLYHIMNLARKPKNHASVSFNRGTIFIDWSSYKHKNCVKTRWLKQPKNAYFKKKKKGKGEKRKKKYK